jgi:hypothetical protein
MPFCTSGKVKVETSAGATVATFNVSGTYVSANFHVGADRSADLLVSYATATAAEILGGYATEFAEPPWPTTCLRSIRGLALSSGAGTDSGVFGFRGENHGNVDSAREPWGVSDGSFGLTGLGLGLRSIGGRVERRGVKSGWSRGGDHGPAHSVVGAERQAMARPGLARSRGASRKASSQLRCGGILPRG